MRAAVGHSGDIIAEDGTGKSRTENPEPGGCLPRDHLLDCVPPFGAEVGRSGDSEAADEHHEEHRRHHFAQREAFLANEERPHRPEESTIRHGVLYDAAERPSVTKAWRPWRPVLYFGVGDSGKGGPPNA